MVTSVNTPRAVTKVPAHAIAQVPDKAARPELPLVAAANDIVSKHVPDGLFISGFKLAISSDNFNCPADRVREIYGRGDNINQGRGEHYIYIVPTRTNTYPDAITGVRIGIPPSYAVQVGDLTSGASSNGYRHLTTKKEKGKSPIVDWCLIRGRENIPAGWHFKTTDVNQDRKGDCLYLCSKLW